MFKWLRKKMLKGFIQDIITELPEPDLLKERLFEIFEEHKDEIFAKIKELVINFLKDKLNK